MEGAAHSPGVVVPVSAASVVMASAAGTTMVRGLVRDHSHTVVDLRPLAGDREAAGAGLATATMILAVGAGGVTATDEVSDRFRSVNSIWLAPRRRF
jgi:hypothetical protein